MSRARPTITLIAAMDAQGVIGAEGGMPWHIPDDLRWFKQQTRGKPVLMGRRTFESIGRALPQRRNFVMTRDPGFAAADIEVVSGIEAALAAAATDGAPELMVTGGAQIYALALPRAKRLVLTRIDARYAGDTFFPEVDWSGWEQASREHVDADGDTPAHAFVIYRRRD